MRKTWILFFSLCLLTMSCGVSTSKPLTISTQLVTAAMSATLPPLQTATATPTATGTPAPTNTSTPTATPTPAGMGLDNFDEFVQVRNYEDDILRVLEEIVTDPSTPKEVNYTAYSSDGDYFAAGGGYGGSRGGEQRILYGDKAFVIILDAHTGERVSLIPLQGARVNSLSFSSDGKKLAYAVMKPGELIEIAIWDIESNQMDRMLLQAKAGETDNPQVAFQPHGSRIVVVATGNLTVWDSVSGEKVAEIPQYKINWYEYLLGFNTSGSRFAFAIRKNIYELPVKAIVYDTSTWEAISTINYEKFNLATAYSPDGKWIVTALKDEHKILVWNAETGEQTGTLDNIIDNDIRVSFSPDSSLLFATGLFPIDSDLPPEASQAVAIVWNTSTWQMAGYFHDYKNYSYKTLAIPKFSADGRSFISGNAAILFALPGATYLENQQKARQIVSDFQEALSKDDYETAAAMVDPSNIPQDFIDHGYGNDPLSILKSLCEHKSHPCLPVKNAFTDRKFNLDDGIDYYSSAPPDRFDFILQLENPDGSIYRDKGGRYNFYLGLVLAPDGKNYQIRLHSIITYGIYW